MLVTSWVSLFKIVEVEGKDIKKDIKMKFIFLFFYQISKLKKQKSSILEKNTNEKDTYV